MEKLPMNVPTETREHEIDQEKLIGLETRAAEKVLSHLSEQYSDLAFHNTGHTDSVVETTRALASVLNLSAKEQHIAVLASTFHDYWQTGAVVNGKFIRNIELDQDTGEAQLNTEGVPILKPGHNEELSVEALHEFMHEQNELARAAGQQEVYSEADFDAVREAILATVPGFDPEKGTVHQPRLRDVKNKAALLTALADLAPAGMYPERFVSEGLRLWVEENPGMVSELRNMEVLKDERKEEIRKAMLGWVNFQSVFSGGKESEYDSQIHTGGRQDQFVEDLTHLVHEGVITVKEKADLIATFDKFGVSQALAQQTFTDLKNLSLEEIVAQWPGLEGIVSSTSIDAEQVA